MFIGRHSELESLNKRWHSNRFEFIAVYGRRRVGKTVLLNKFCEGKRCVFFPALEVSEADNLRALSQAIAAFEHQEVDAAPIWPDFDSAFRHIAKLAQKERLIFFIDEYPWLAKAKPAISSVLQQFIDHVFLKTNLVLILCGSSQSFMEHQVLGAKNPLYGRRTMQLKVEPFSGQGTAAFLPHYSPQDKALLYGVTGGIPLYANYFNPKLNAAQNIQSLFFSRDGQLLSEPDNLLNVEFKEPRMYNSVIMAVAGGASRLNDIATAVRLSTAECTNYVRPLLELGILTKETPVTEPNSKKTLYSVGDLMMRFWHRFVPQATAAISLGRGDEWFTKMVQPKLPDYMGSVFETLCRQYVQANSSRDHLWDTVGRWWGGNPKTKQPEEIDIVAKDTMHDAMLFGECKFTNEPVGLSVLETLKRRAQLVNGNESRSFVIFAKKGFSPALKKQAAKENVSLVALADLFPEPNKRSQ